MIGQYFHELEKRFRSNHKYLATVVCHGKRSGYRPCSKTLKPFFPKLLRSNAAQEFVGAHW